MFKFLHSADIHLDSPLKGLEAYEDAPIEEIRSATRRAFDKLIEFAIEERVDFFLIVGDLFDGDWKDLNTGLYFAERMGRLKRENIPVFIVSGNHDFASPITKTMPLPDNVTLFSSARVSTVILENIGVAIHGRSYPSRIVTDNLAADYPQHRSNYFNIGLLHTALNGRIDHEPYAPCSLDDLRSKAYDYWALGHIHQREVVSEDPWVVFPGNIQGRKINEQGSKGATLVTVEAGTVTERHLELDVLRWFLCRVNLSECESIEAVHAAVRVSIEAAQQEAAGRTLAIRLVLEGKCPIHARLLDQQSQLSEVFRISLVGYGNIWLEKILFRTTRVNSLEEVVGQETPLADLLCTIEDLKLEKDFLFQEMPELVDLKNKVPSELLNDEEIFLSGHPDQLQTLRQEVQELLIAKLLQHEEGGDSRGDE